MSGQTTRRTFLRSMGAVGGTGLLSAWFPYRSALLQETRDLARSESDNGFSGLRKAYGLSPDVTYLNHASIGTMPNPVRDALARYVATCETNPWLHIWSDVWEEAHDRTRQKAADFIGCSLDELVLNHNTTEGFNLLAQGLPLGSGDEVLFSSLNHTGASACWEHQAETRKFRVRRFRFPVEDVPRMKTEDILNRYDSEIGKQTRVLVFPHVDNTVGLRHPVKELAELARSRGVHYVAVDGAQTVGMLPFHVRDLGVDFYATSAHKWIQGPKGRGLLYVREELLPRLRPMMVTWGQSIWKDSARKYEDYGTRDLPSILAIEDALDFQNHSGTAKKEAHYRALWRHALGKVDGMPNLVWHSPRSWELSASLFSFAVKDKSSKSLFRSLFEEHGFVFRAFESDELNVIRISPNTLNTTDDLDRLFAQLA